MLSALMGVSAVSCSNSDNTRECSGMPRGPDPVPTPRKLYREGGDKVTGRVVCLWRSCWTQCPPFLRLGFPSPNTTGQFSDHLSARIKPSLWLHNQDVPVPTVSRGEHPSLPSCTQNFPAKTNSQIPSLWSFCSTALSDSYLTRPRFTHLPNGNTRLERDRVLERGFGKPWLGSWFAPGGGGSQAQPAHRQGLWRPLQPPRGRAIHTSSSGQRAAGLGGQCPRAPGPRARLQRPMQPAWPQLERQGAGRQGGAGQLG